MNPTPLSVPAADQAAGRSRKLTAIVRCYRGFYEDLERSGAVPYRMTELGAWAASRAPHVYYFFKLVNLGGRGLFVDLGSGDGIVSCIAGLFTRSVGIEIDPGLCAIAQAACRKLGLEEAVSFICGDYLGHRIDRAGSLYLYPDKPFDRLEQILCGWKGTLLVYGPHLPPPTLHPVSRLQCGREQMVLYEATPAERRRFSAGPPAAGRGAWAG